MILPRQVAFAVLFLVTLLAGVLTSVSGFCQSSDSSLLVEDLRIGQDAGRTRIVLQFAPEASQQDVNYRWFTLPEPARVVLDFGDITFKTPPNLVRLPEGGMVKGMRAGRFRPQTVRMVLDLEKASRVNVFAIPGSKSKGPRLVMDIAPVKKGQKPTNVPPPADVVEAGKAPAVNPRRIEEEPAPIVPPKVTQSIDRKTRDHVVVVLDPGHGGVDPGACGRTLKVCEHKLTLEMAKLVRENLRNDKINVVLTRDTDVFVPLPERVRIAQRNNADLFVSLHADIHPSKRDVKGATVYMVSERASDREAARLADSENAGDVLAGVGLERENAEVRNILISLVQRDTLNGSAYLGRNILDSMGTVTAVRKKDLLFAGFRVLKAPDVPSVLVEMGYLSNPTEERQLNNPAFRKKLAEAIAKGIRSYISEHVHY